MDTYVDFYKYSIYNGKLQDGNILYWAYFYYLKNKCHPDNLKLHCENTLGYPSKNISQICDIIYFASEFRPSVNILELHSTSVRKYIRF